MVRELDPHTDPQALKQGLAAKAREFIPPVRLDMEDGAVDGFPVVVAPDSVNGRFGSRP